MAGTRTTCSRESCQDNEFGQSHRDSLPTRSAKVVGSHTFLARIPKAPVSSVVTCFPRDQLVCRDLMTDGQHRAHDIVREQHSLCFLRGRQQNLSRFRHGSSMADRGAEVLKAKKTPQVHASQPIFLELAPPALAATEKTRRRSFCLPT